ncbi:PepSY domain-containing protein [Piscinibacter gummiphilus]|uniref:PepSY domain-containing protein n=1 Tax=Piscinibacter gummiphilus TaxID=946333 RepID=A0ABZ0CVL4_9BURK|nr:PepSY domain-containing protein [Piscinibacter gummiphilus]WOB08541.1 PepSY domain-containing protein [Piscinibacter gummiphilus]
MKHLFLVATLTLLATGTAQAHGDIKCTTPKADWRGQMELQSKLTAEGWKVRKVKVENGCYEVYGFDPKGQKAEAFFDPKSFEPVLPAGQAAPK